MVNNLVNLNYIDEKIMIKNIKERFNNNKIYTLSDDILISVNPYQNLDLYNNKYVEKYEKKKIFNKNKEAHIFLISQKAHINMITLNKNQSILISGESGAGKTFATKKIINYYCKKYHNNNNNNSLIEDNIIISNPIIEVFGNCKTLINNNSSRFGKFIKLYFDENNKVNGASIETYLLEKVRIIKQRIGEKNFHIFYIILNNLNLKEKEKYCLENIENYDILTDKSLKDNIYDLNFEQLKNLMFKIGFKLNEFENIILFLSFILNLGNVKIENNKIINENYLKICSNLIKYDYNYIKKLFLIDTSIIGNEKFDIKLIDSHANYVKKTLIKILYEMIFDYIIKKINKDLDNKSKYKNFIGILDIFGFECFENNYFEQFCINFANELMQNQFNNHVINNEINIYNNEGIDFNSCNFINNDNCINLIHKNINCMFSVLDEETLFPEGNDYNLYDKYNYLFKDNENYICNKKKNI